MKQALIYFGVFLICQALSGILAQILFHIFGTTAVTLVEQTVVGASLYSIASLVIFFYAKWCPTNGSFSFTPKVTILCLASLLSLSLVVPSSWFQEMIPESLTKDVMADVFDKLMKRPEGYIVIGLLAPLVEEVVFRGAILRKLIEWIGDSFGGITNQKRWIAIVISAILFSIAHMNPAQMPHALFGGILLGWLYCRTGSIIPGIIYHWVNNSIAFAIVAFLPNISYDAKLVEVFGGNESLVLISVVVSIIVAIPCLWMLNRKMCHN